MIDTGLRIRVERLLRDDFRVEDLTTLFLALRDRCEGREAIREIGDFVAHRDERTKGITTTAVRDFFTSSRFVVEYNLAKKSVSMADLPANFMDILYATFRRLDNKILKSQTHLKRSAAERLLENISTRVTKSSDGKLFLAWPTSDDVRLIKCLTSYLVSRAAFDEESLFQEFSDTLIANGLLNKKEVRTLLRMKGTIALYAVAYMHQCEIVLNDGTKANLFAMRDTGGGFLGVTAVAQVDMTKKINFGGPIFQTNMVASSCCEDNLLQIERWERSHIELKATKKLGLLT
jgi:hypothetical protein